MNSQADNLWKCIIEKKDRDALNLQPGATAEEIQLIENTLGVTLPEEMKSFYSVYNGQAWDVGVESFVRNLTLSSLAEIMDNWLFLQGGI